MKGLIMSFLEAIRPPFWEGDYNFLWIYLISIVLLIVLYESLSQHLSLKSAMNPARVNDLKLQMQNARKLQQEKFELSKPTPSEVRISKEENKEPSKPEEKPLKNDKKVEKKELKEENKEEKDEKLERAKKKSEYFSGSSGPGGYRPNVKDRYPGVYKRGG
jgi:outer membrane biosynthesis protein TonB